MALSVLNQMEGGDDVLKPNTWVYNAAMLACTESIDSKSNGMNLVTSFDILEKMEMNGVNDTAAPDTVTYNTALSALDDCSFASAKETMSLTEKNKVNHTRLSKHDRIYEVVIDILDTMKDRGVARDAITYYNAIMACKSNW